MEINTLNITGACSLVNRAVLKKNKGSVIVFIIAMKAFSSGIAMLMAYDMLATKNITANSNKIANN